jgi:YgiT-type zinc finger domain-containing protein
MMMTCQACGSELKSVVTDMPFKVSDRTIVILKGLPVLQCENCVEYQIEDEVMAQVETILGRADRTAELEIVRYAA